MVGEPSSPPGPALLQAARACLGKEGTFQPNQAAAHKGTRLGGDASHRHPCAPAGPRDPWDAVGLLRPGHKRGPAGTKAREAFQSKAPWVLVFHPRVESAWPGSGFQTLAFWPLCGRPQDGWPQRARCCWGPPGKGGMFKPKHSPSHERTWCLDCGSSNRSPCTQAGPVGPWAAEGLALHRRKRGLDGTKARVAFQSPPLLRPSFHHRAAYPLPGGSFQTLLRCCWRASHQAVITAELALGGPFPRAANRGRVKPNQPPSPNRTRLP